MFLHKVDAPAAVDDLNRRQRHTDNIATLNVDNAQTAWLNHKFTTSLKLSNTVRRCGPTMVDTFEPVVVDCHVKKA